MRERNVGSIWGVACALTTKHVSVKEGTRSNVFKTKKKKIFFSRKNSNEKNEDDAMSVFFPMYSLVLGHIWNVLTNKVCSTHSKIQF